VFRPCLTIYREAINSANPYYRLLCLYRVGERLREIQNENGKKLARIPGFSKKPTIISDTELTRTYFSSYVGKKLNVYLDNHVREVYRNNIAHLSMNKGSFDANGNMLLPAADNKIDTTIEATNAVLISVINDAIKEEIITMKKYNIA
jgi:hypothetical protein